MFFYYVFGMNFREALEEDLEDIVGMLAEDKLGARREELKSPLPSSYTEAFKQIETDPNNELIVVEKDNFVIGTLQLTFIPSLTFKGGTRLQIEAVRVHKDYRSQGLGKKFFEWAIERAKSRNCHLVQLTTNKERDRAKDFYDSLGFETTHEGMKLYLKPW